MKKLLLALVALLPLTANAQLYPLFGPSTGIMKGDPSTPQTSSAVSSDVVGLFSGTCDSSHFLAGNGSCLVPAGTGVTSVGLTAPSVFSVSGSPVTSSGTLALSFATGQTANRVLATPDGTTGAVSLRALVAGDIPPINLGSVANGGVASASILLGTNGGTSNGFFSVTGPATSLKTFTFPNASATVLTTNAAVTVAQGGTSLATLTSNGVMLGEGTSAPNFVVMGADTVLRGTASADPVATSVNNCGSSTQALSYSTSTHTFGCQTISVGGSGTVTSISAGTGISLSPSPITSTGSVAIDTTAALTWSAQIQSSVAVGGTSSAFYVNSALASYGWRMTGGGTDAKVWDAGTGTSTNDWMLRALNDAGSTARTAIDIARSAAAISSITFGNTTDQPSVTMPTSGLTLSNTASSFNPLVACANGQASGSRCFTVRLGGGGDFLIDTSDDAGSPQKVGLQILRSGTAVGSIAIGNATDNPTVSIPGTGSFTVGGQTRTSSGTVSAASATNTTVFTVGTFPSTYFVNCSTQGQTSSTYDLAGTVTAQSSGQLATSTLISTGNMSLVVSGNNIQCSQNSGSTATISWAVFRWGV